MFNALTLRQAQAFARQDSIIVAVLWLASMWSVIHHPTSSWGALLVVCTPFVIGWRMKTFRDDVLEGVMSFRRGLCYCGYVVFYASLLFAIGQYLYFRFLDGGTFVAMLSSAVDTVAPIYEQYGVSVAELRESEHLLSTMTPMQLTLTFMLQNLIAGIPLSLLLALIFKKSKR